MDQTRSRLLYVEPLDGEGPARIVRAHCSRSRRTVTFDGRTLVRCTDAADRYSDGSTGRQFRVAGPKRNGRDGHPFRPRPVLIDEEARDEYWRAVRGRVLPMAAV